MATQEFTRNFTDHSNDLGFQFEFHCDKCGNGVRSSFVTNKAGVAAGLMGAASSLFGGFLGSAANASRQMKDMLRGPAWDEAFAKAAAECRPRFKQCNRCGAWVCPGSASTTSAASARAVRPTSRRKPPPRRPRPPCHRSTRRSRRSIRPAASTPTPAAPPPVPTAARPPAPESSARSAGQSLASDAPCAKCGAMVAAMAKFCPECGAHK